jgi:predicted ArsR family transcriptional regulator
MAGLGSIPDEVKWRIAAEFSAQLPALYDRAFRSTVGERYDEIEQEIWMVVAQSALAIAKNLSLPVGTAQDLAETMRTVMIILFGPEFRSETLEISKDGAVIIVRHCPLIEASYTTGTDGDRTFGKCMAFTLTGIPRLNNNFSARFVRTMCSGDRQCEIKVAQSQPPVPDKKGKK